MTNVSDIQHTYTDNFCELKLNLKKSYGSGRSIENIRNCDVFIEEHYFLIYLDVQLYKFYSIRLFDMKDLKNIILYYNRVEKELTIFLPCLPLVEEEVAEKDAEEGAAKGTERQLDLWKLKRITDNCLIKINDKAELMRPEGSYEYGFASKYSGKIRSYGCDLHTITRMPEPCDVSPLQRMIDRDIDEMKNFNREQYLLNVVELQVPDGLDNPLLYSFDYQDDTLSQNQENLRHNITQNPDLNSMPDEYDFLEVDCGLINILLGICYDVRFTSNTPNCESAWTRSVLSATLTYFEPFISLKEVVSSFMRCSLIYPLYRNYELSRQCVEDCVTALQSNPKWIMKQLLISHELFDDTDRSVFNNYYIDDYIRYIANSALCPVTHLEMLAYNLKNVLLDIFKKDIGLGLQELEAELLKELVTDIHLDLSTSEEDDYDDDASSTLSTDETSSDNDDDSVIEKKLNSLKLSES